MERASDMQSKVGLTILFLALAGSVTAVAWNSLAPLHGDAQGALLAGPTAETGTARGLRASTEAESAERGARRAEPRAGETIEEEDLRGARAARPGSERALRGEYLALERATPGILAARAQEWLGASRPAAEKVAWLSAMQESDAASAMPWLEFACGTDEPASAVGESPASFALGQLIELAPRDGAAIAALGRVASARETIDVTLRRRAATACATFGDATLLRELAQALPRERDEALRAGVVIALEARTDPESRLEADRLLSWLRPASAEYLARDATGSP